MKNGISLFLSGLMLSSISSTTVAQDSDYHPALSNNFDFSVGAYRSDNSLTIAAGNREIGGDDIDFGDSVGVDQSSTIANIQLRWNFGKTRKWSLSAQYFSNDATGDATLKEDVDWQDVTFQEGTFVEAGLKIEVARLFLGRSFVKNAQHDFGVGLGVHNLDISAFIGGEIIANGETTGHVRVDAGGSQILPNLGTWYRYSPAKKWMLHGRIDWISANIGDYDGTLWNVNAGVGFQPWQHVGFDLSYQYFNLNLKVDSSDWVGGADITYSGPVVSMTATW